MSIRIDCSNTVDGNRSLAAFHRCVETNRNSRCAEIKTFRIYSKCGAVKDCQPLIQIVFFADREQHQLVFTNSALGGSHLALGEHIAGGNRHLCLDLCNVRILRLGQAADQELETVVAAELAILFGVCIVGADVQTDPAVLAGVCLVSRQFVDGEIDHNTIGMEINLFRHVHATTLNAGCTAVVENLGVSHRSPILRIISHCEG